MEENKFIQIIESNSVALASDLVEISLDSFISNETLKDIPVIGTITKLLSIGYSINDKIFIRKLIRFLSELNGLEQNFILKEIKYLDDSSEYNHKVGEKLLELITRIDSEGKPEILGKLFRNFIMKNISQYDFLKLSDIVEKVFYYDLILLKECKNDKFYINLDEELYNFGLIEGKGMGTFNSNDEERAEFEKTTYLITERGKKILEYGLK
ncbi:hypothetical protein ACM40_18330 [Chryseobacterium sp. BLS98]|uniref:hypothetical protein n=1 Tax=Chryseobacterium sp. BLS98 TaxID=885586 RepID=UPI00065AA1C1|nr:hypothetical protein [Chryseobacterium sp. BLS98]KMQ58922.1 hypothetical protein ACM40_18330 [Chryseobacterium sp. BLS98]